MTNFQIRLKSNYTNLLIQQKPTLSTKQGSVVSIKGKHSLSFWMGSHIWPHNTVLLSVPKALLGEVEVLRNSHTHTHSRMSTHIWHWGQIWPLKGCYWGAFIMTTSTFSYHRGQLVLPLTSGVTLSSEAEWRSQCRIEFSFEQFSEAELHW